jgi:hypothetical protein
MTKKKKKTRMKMSRKRVRKRNKESSPQINHVIRHGRLQMTLMILREELEAGTGNEEEKRKAG